MELFDRQLQIRQSLLRAQPHLAYSMILPSKRMVRDVLLPIIALTLLVRVGPAVLLTIVHASSLLVQTAFSLCRICFSALGPFGM